MDDKAMAIDLIGVLGSIMQSDNAEIKFLADILKRTIFELYELKHTVGRINAEREFEKIEYSRKSNE